MIAAVFLYTHVVGAVVGLLSGMLAMLFRKGSGLHGAAGSIFFGSMVVMSLSAVWVATFVHSVGVNVVAGTLTFYLVLTAWWASKRRDGRARRSDAVALVYVAAVAAGSLAAGVGAVLNPASRNREVPTPAYFIFGLVAACFAIADVRMLRRGGYPGVRRIARHLWRMGLALMIALLSLYPGRPRVFPQSWRASNLLLVPHVLVFGALLFSLARRRQRRKADGDASLHNRNAAAVAR